MYVWFLNDNATLSKAVNKKEKERKKTYTVPTYTLVTQAIFPWDKRTFKIVTSIIAFGQMFEKNV